MEDRIKPREAQGVLSLVLEHGITHRYFAQILNDLRFVLADDAPHKLPLLWGYRPSSSHVVTCIANAPNPFPGERLNLREMTSDFAVDYCYGGCPSNCEYNIPSFCFFLCNYDRLREILPNASGLGLSSLYEVYPVVMCWLTAIRCIIGLIACYMIWWKAWWW